MTIHVGSSYLVIMETILSKSLDTFALQTYHIYMQKFLIYRWPLTRYYSHIDYFYIFSNLNIMVDL